LSLQKYKYCNSLFKYSRYNTREVTIGDVPLGGNNPIRIQSMTTTDTMNTIATVEQSIRMIDAGCEYVRITAPSIKEAKNLQEIKNELRKRGYKTPIIADIHFTPNAAETAARIVEKVRINPGNYIDKKKFQTKEYSDSEYEAEIDRIVERFSPLVKICKEYGTAIRIGANHGSLSDRILSRYGDTPLGMVESALEFVRICQQNDFHNIVLSMKASNTRVMVQAYRLLCNKMQQEGMNYPLHIGVTEAGDGEDGRIKSSVGIGALLEDGIGDTVRVSLTENPEFEIPVAKILVSRYFKRENHDQITEVKSDKNPFEYSRRETFELIGIGGSNVPKVVAALQNHSVKIFDLSAIGYFYDAQNDKWTMSDNAADFIYLGNNSLSFEPPTTLRMIYDYEHWITINNSITSYPLMSSKEYLNFNNIPSLFYFVKLYIDDLNKDLINKIKEDKFAILILETKNHHGMAEQRAANMLLELNKIQNPLIIKRNYENIDEEKFQIHAATDFGSLLIDGYGDGVWVEISNRSTSTKSINRILFGILQAARTRITKTEYIACPSCGRTLFDLQETTEKIRKQTEHLKGVKIAIMGCIVNGPGEMADADYGYVGSGIGKITLYKGKEVVKRNVNSNDAVNELILLIKNDGKWIEPI
jgi:(E)-4-hydroxy-3-methylbut-2-enyl-diphosphate synthase